MKHKNSDYVSGVDTEYRDAGFKNSSSNDFELYNEADDIPNRVVRIKRVNLPNKGESWRIYEDTTVVETILGTRLTVKEREFMRSVAGIVFTMQHYKSGWKNFTDFKSCLKQQFK